MKRFVEQLGLVRDWSPILEWMPVAILHWGLDDNRRAVEMCRALSEMTNVWDRVTVSYWQGDSFQAHLVTHLVVNCWTCDIFPSLLELII